MLERLTERQFGEIVSKRKEETGISCSSFCNNCSQGTGNCKYVKAMVEKLAEYADLEEQGLLLKLPCKVGDTVYIIEVEEEKSEHFHHGIKLLIKVSKHEFNFWMIPIFGKFVFLTETEAKEALKRKDGLN